MDTAAALLVPLPPPPLPPQAAPPLLMVYHFSPRHSENAENLTNHCKFHKGDGRFALRKYSPISKKDLAVRFEITALPLILKKILLPSLDLTIKAWALFKGTKASRMAGLGNHSSRAAWGWEGWACPLRAGNVPGNHAPCSFSVTLEMRSVLSGEAGSPTHVPSSSLSERWLYQSWSPVQCYSARRTRGQETGGKRPQIPAPLGAAVMVRCPLAPCLLNLLPSPEILLKEDSFTFTCGIRLRNFQPLPLLTPLSKPLTPNVLAKKMISLKKKSTRVGITH